MSEKRGADIKLSTEFYNMALECNNPTNGDEMARAWSALADSLAGTPEQKLGGVVYVNSQLYTYSECLFESAKCNPKDPKTWLLLGTCGQCFQNDPPMRFWRLTLTPSPQTLASPSWGTIRSLIICTVSKKH